MFELQKMVIGEDEVNAVDAREVWKFLEIKTHFPEWIKNRINVTGFIQGTDFIGKQDFLFSPPRKDYFVSINMAKHICMMERNEKGNQARDYFIACETKAKELSHQLPKTKIELIECWLHSEKEKEKLQIKNQTLQITQEENKPLVEFAELITDSSKAIDIGTYAKELSKNGFKIGRTRLFTHMRNHKFLMSNNVPYQKYIENGYFKVISVLKNDQYYPKTLITGKGQINIFKILQFD